ncbi:MAG TPA: hypothetical protein VNI20_04060, partial [Fimbriimonadaceae bacterium]|nr:hypothetical protein [Fimbriimonadaceae bacterium]
NAYYSTVLTNSLFSAQKGTSYFAINYGDWVILGLDSAYNATSFYLDGRIDDAYQPGFVNPLVQGKNTFLMTHHNPMDIVGATLNTLWTDVVQGCFGGTQPDVWYWGHVHNGVVYNGSAPTGQTASRCLGNAAIPIGDGYWLDSASGVEYYTHTPLGDTDPNNALRVKNGFAIVEVSSSGIQETFYDQDGNVGWQS